jgi:hypothetical protein
MVTILAIADVRKLMSEGKPMCPNSGPDCLKRKLIAAGAS